MIGAIDVNIESLIQLGLGGAALGILFLLFRPLVAAMVRSQDSFVAGQKEFASALREIALSVHGMRTAQEQHFEEDRRRGDRILDLLQQRGSNHNHGPQDSD
jgi:hypothetical protein